jgi:hypothetical protein
MSSPTSATTGSNDAAHHAKVEKMRELHGTVSSAIGTVSDPDENDAVMHQKLEMVSAVWFILSKTVSIRREAETINRLSMKLAGPTIT